MAITTRRMPKIPHPLRWASIWFLTVVVGFGVTSHQVVQGQRARCEAFRTEDAPAAFASFARYLGERSGLTEEEIQEALAEIDAQIREDLPASEC